MLSHRAGIETTPENPIDPLPSVPAIETRQIPRDQSDTESRSPQDRCDHETRHIHGKFETRQ
jgi:hypothetical protein